MNPQKIKFGVLGSSRVALKGMLPAMHDSELVEIVMIGSRSPEKGKGLAHLYGATFGSYEDVLRNNKVDAVYICFPNSLHEEWTIRALNAGKHVLCEKPAATTYAAAKRMVEVAKKNNIRLLEGLMFRYHPQHAKVKELINNGTLGDLLKFDGCFAFALPERSSTAMNKDLGGGSFNDEFCYPVSASRMIFGEEPQEVFCTIKMDPQSGVDVKVDAMLTYSNNKSAFASSILGSHYQSTYSVLGTKGIVRMGRAYSMPRDTEVKVFLETDDKKEEIIFPYADHFRLMVEDFAKEIIKGSESTKDYEGDLLCEARVLEAARLSDKEKRVVKISEIN